MKKGKLLIITTTTLMLSLSGFLIYNLAFDRFGPNKDKDTGTASAMGVSPDDNSGNYTYIPPTFEYDGNNGNEEEPSMTDNKTPWAPTTEMDLDPESITVYVNKEYALPKDYVPNDMVIPNVLFDIVGYDERKLLRAEPAKALELMFNAATADGYTLYGISGYRSYDRQKQIFTSNIVKKGKNHTLKYSAVPGTSEHQTGLAMDVSSKSMKYRLITPFATSPEGIWLADNAHRFGFIIRYTKEKENITGYAYEPWHIRYVGKDLANYLYTNDLTLDEYYKYEPSEGFDFEAKYAELINYKPPITPADLDGDGIPNNMDEDIDGDGLKNGMDDDVDGDGISNGLDDDIDGDGITNDKDEDIDGDGFANDKDEDMDGDGLTNDLDDDVDGDGFTNNEDTDIDGDGLTNDVDEDIDGDGLTNDLDEDIDGDGLTNELDEDMDGDGILNDNDEDMDGDGLTNEDDDDMNGNGIHDFKENSEEEAPTEEIPDDEEAGDENSEETPSSEDDSNEEGKPVEHDTDALEDPEDSTSEETESKPGSVPSKEQPLPGNKVTPIPTITPTVEDEAGQIPINPDTNLIN